jgi:hypothetical protein
MYSMRENHRHWHLTKTSITISSPVLEKTSHFISSNIQQKWVLYGFIMFFSLKISESYIIAPSFKKLSAILRSSRETCRAGMAAGSKRRRELPGGGI